MSARAPRLLVIALADTHGSAAALRALGPELARADLLLLAGDLTHFGHRREASDIITEARTHARVLAVPGNCDFPEVGAYLAEEGLSLDGRSAVIAGIAFLGVGGSLPCPGATPNEMSEDEFAAHLEAAAAGIAPDMPAILLTHQPPHGTAVDRAGANRHVGSRAVRAFIEQRCPLVCFSGHIHEARAEDRLGDTVLLNPGPAREGGFAYAEVDPAARALVRAGLAGLGKDKP